MSIVSFLSFRVVSSQLTFFDRMFFFSMFPSYRLEGTEEKFRNRESRPEDLQLIAELKDMVSERESLVKKLVVGNWWLSSTT